MSRVEAIQITQPPVRFSSALQSNREAKLVSSVTGHFKPVTWVAWLVPSLFFFKVIFKVEL